MSVRLLRSVSFSLLILTLTAQTRADDPGTITDALKAPILDSKTTLEETRNFVEARIPRMPNVASAEEWTAKADQYRHDVFQNVIFRGEAAGWRDADLKVEWLDTIDGGPGYKIKKLRYEALPGLWIPALLYEPENIEGKVPVILNVNGHDTKNGKSADYKQLRCINQAKRGMLALNIEWFGMGQFHTDGFRHGLINAIDLTGTSGIATHYLAMKRGVDILLSHEHADPERVAVTGLSGGGWQTIFYSPLDTRVKLTDPVAGYSSFFTRTRFFEDLGDPEQTPCDLATVVDYTHLTAMMAPRPT
ncbi:MAG TPA: acetylxylan esterase, partial [Isosphaeraceae bacterium]|nr:acetylxylan esterase [Isosphaeraceae bacterium]